MPSESELALASFDEAFKRAFKRALDDGEMIIDTELFEAQDKAQAVPDIFRCTRGHAWKRGNEVGAIVIDGKPRCLRCIVESTQPGTVEQVE